MQLFEIHDRSTGKPWWKRRLWPELAMYGRIWNLGDDVIDEHHAEMIAREMMETWLLVEMGFMLTKMLRPDGMVVVSVQNGPDGYSYAEPSDLAGLFKCCTSVAYRHHRGPLCPM